MHENAIEFYSEEDTATVSFTKKRMINKILKLKESHPDEVDILAQNLDGSICAHVPVRWIKVSPPRRMSDEQRETLTARLSRSSQPQGEIDVSFES